MYFDANKSDHDIVRNVIEESSASKAFKEYFGSEYYMWSFPDDTEPEGISHFILEEYHSDDEISNEDIAERLEKDYIFNDEVPKWVENLWSLSSTPDEVGRFEEELYDDVWKRVNNFRFRKTLENVFPEVRSEIPSKEEI